MKKALLILSIIGALGLAFGAGWRLKGNEVQSQINASIQPAENIVKQAIAGTSLSSAYTETSKLYRKTESGAQFTEKLSPFKGTKITSNKTYTGDYDSQSIFELTKDGKTQTVVVGTVNEDGKWVVSSLVVTSADQ